MKFREILSHLISQWALTSQFCYGSGLVVAERTCWEKCFVGSGKRKIITKTEVNTDICRLDTLSVSFWPLEGRWENRVLQVSWWLIGNTLFQDIAKFQNFSRGDEELLVTTKIPTNLSCVRFVCVLDPGDTFGMTVRWLLQTVPWDVSPWHSGQDIQYH